MGQRCHNAGRAWRTRMGQRCHNAGCRHSLGHKSLVGRVDEHRQTNGPHLNPIKAQAHVSFFSSDDDRYFA